MWMPLPSMIAARRWGNGSVWNRWGWKQCLTATTCTTSGTSLSLLKRLVYTQIFYGTAFFGFEGGFVVGAPPNITATPIGRFVWLAVLAKSID